MLSTQRKAGIFMFRFGLVNYKEIRSKCQDSYERKKTKYIMGLKNADGKILSTGDLNKQYKSCGTIS
jgi:hypothetical protein